MELFGKPVHVLTRDDLQKIVDVGAPSENRFVDYKKAPAIDVGGADVKEQKRIEFLQDVTSFANAGGGWLIYGVDERDTKPIDLCGFAVGPGGVDGLVQRMGDLIRHGVESTIQPTPIIQPIQVDDNRWALVIQIKPSRTSPNMVTFADSRTFHHRVNAKNEPMSAPQITDAVLRSESGIMQIEGFINDRFSLLIENSGNQSFWALMFIPLHRDFNAIDITSPDVCNVLKQLVPSPFDLNSGHSTHTLDGYLRFINSEMIRTYHNLVFRDGSVECVGFSGMNKRREGDYRIHLGEIANQHFPITFERVTGMFKHLMPSQSFAVSACVCLHEPMGVYPIAEFDECHEMPAGIVKSQTAVMELGSDPHQTMRSFHNLLWNASGHRRCPAYDFDGNFVGWNSQMWKYI